MGRVLCGAVALLAKAHEEASSQLQAVLWMLGTMGCVAQAHLSAFLLGIASPLDSEINRIVAALPELPSDSMQAIHAMTTPWDAAACCRCW